MLHLQIRVSILHQKCLLDMWERLSAAILLKLAFWHPLHFIQRLASCREVRQLVGIEPFAIVVVFQTVISFTFHPYKTVHFWVPLGKAFIHILKQHASSFIRLYPCWLLTCIMDTYCELGGNWLSLKHIYVIWENWAIFFFFFSK